MCMVLKTVLISTDCFDLVAHIAMFLSIHEGRGIIPATPTDRGPSTGGASAPLTSCPTESFAAWMAATVKEKQLKVDILGRRKT